MELVTEISESTSSIAVHNSRSFVLFLLDDESARHLIWPILVSSKHENIEDEPSLNTNLIRILLSVEDF